MLAGATALWFRRAMAVRLPADRRAFVAAWLLAAGLGAAALAQAGSFWVGVPAALATLGGAFLCATVAISAQKGGSGAFQVGAPLPDFTAPDDAGEPFTLSSLAGRPLLLKFFRGHW